MIWRGLSGWRHSLQQRVLAATLVGLALALVLAGLLLNSLFRDHATQAFQADLAAHLEQLTARLDFDAQGQPVIDPATLSDPRWDKPHSGRYWQVDVRRGTVHREGVLRSRSLWDQTLSLPDDVVADGAVHVHRLVGPTGLPALALERSVRSADTPGDLWTLAVAADTPDMQRAMDQFAGVLAASLAGLLGLLSLAAVAQVWFGLAPLRALQAAVADVGEGRSTRLQGQFPAEIQPLVDDFNRTLQRQEDGLVRARTQAGNLAHALKTPLAVLLQASQDVPPQARELARQVAEQVHKARQHVDWHLKHARASASVRLPGVSCPLAPTVHGLLRVMERVHADRALDLEWSGCPPEWAFAGEAQDLQEMLGNLIDNACQWARHRVRVSAQEAVQVPNGATGEVVVLIEDDGPGIPEAQRALMLQRGVRLDESTPGSGLGLAIVADLAALYGGQLVLGTSEWGGHQAMLHLPLLRAASGRS